MRLTRILITALLLLPVPAALSAAPPGDYPPLRESLDPGLQNALQNVLKELGLSKAVRRKDLAVALVDITDLNAPRVASVNGDEMLYAASLPKIAILLGAFVRAERGELKLTRDVKQSLTRMIRVSSNRDATRMLNRVGKQELIDILRSDRYRLYDPAYNGGLWVGKEYGKSPAYRRDPLHNLSHGATAMQTARFYYMLETRRLLSEDLTGQMKAMLSRPAIRHKFVKGLERYPGVQIFRKSGTWKHWHADSALVQSGKHKYIAVALAQLPNGSTWLSRIIQRLHELVVPTEIAGVYPYP